MTTHKPRKNNASVSTKATNTKAASRTTQTPARRAKKASAAQAEDASASPVAWADRNPELRRRYLAVEVELKNADASGDTVTANAKRRELERIGREFVELNRGLAIQQARLFARNTADDEDNIRAAELGLWEAFTRFDPDRGVAFSTFSRQHISGGVQRTVRRNEFQHLSQTEFNLRKQIRLAQMQLAAKLGRQPSIEELATNCALPLEKVEKVLSPSNASLDSVIGEDGFTLGDRLESVLNDDDEGESVEDFLHNLTDLELWILLQRGGFLGSSGVSLVEAADGIGIGREVARRAETRAKVRLASAAIAERLGRLAEVSEIASLMQVEPSHVTEYNTLSVEEVHARWRRCCDALRFAGSDYEQRRASERLDRCGEEFMALVSDMVFDAAGRYVGADNRAIGTKEAVRIVWEAFLSWTPGTVTFPAQFRDALAGTYRRTRTVTPQKPLPPDELFYLVQDRRLG
jgi:DNA-directed RNA polymerase sigma subunit (sigma70/sigma32)